MNTWIRSAIGPTICIPTMLLLGVGATQAQTPLGVPQLLEKLRRFEAYKPADEFAPSYDQQQLVGLPFRIVAPVRKPGSGMSGAVDAVWSYNGDRRELALDAFAGRWMPQIWTAGPRAGGPFVGLLTGVSLSSVTTPQGSYIGSNAYGAKVSVNKSLKKSYGLAFVDQPEGAPFSFLFGFNSKVSMPPEDARAVSAGINLVLEGTLVAGLQGSAACGISHSEPELDSPEDVTEQSCLLFAKLETVSFETASDKRVLARWSRTPSPASQTASPSSSVPVSAPVAATDSPGLKVQIGVFGSADLAAAALRASPVVPGATAWQVEKIPNSPTERSLSDSPTGPMQRPDAHSFASPAGHALSELNRRVVKKARADIGAVGPPSLYPLC
jgi:hypothetical protein